MASIGEILSSGTTYIHRVSLNAQLMLPCTCACCLNRPSSPGPVGTRNQPWVVSRPFWHGVNRHGRCSGPDKACMKARITRRPVRSDNVRSKRSPANVEHAMLLWINRIEGVKAWVRPTMMPI
mmetsp:Transcript_16642/g.47450  ORF Transcript_16642/g.47450 Transcript_16642/m.47450 type:complete len:123 (-) Transcript_16642:455-823(-)